MAILSIYIPDSGVDRVYDAICDHYKYQGNVPNPNGGQQLIAWGGESVDLLPIASGYGYTGPLPGTVEDVIVYSDDQEYLLTIARDAGYEGSSVPDPIVPPFVSSTGVKTGEYVYPVIPPFVGGFGSGEMLGVVTGVQPSFIPNPQSKAAFTNDILRGFLAEHTKVYELDQARKQAEANASNAGNVVVDNGSTAVVYDYHMVCLEPAKAQYDALASVIAPGNSFNIPLSANGNDPATHYGLEAGITDTARQQLLVLELAGGTTTGGVQTLFYVRCDPNTGIAQSTNIAGYDIVGSGCNMSGLLSQLGLQVIE